MRVHLIGWLVVSLSLGLAGCGKQSANCEVVVAGEEVCLEGETSRAYCEDEFGGTATSEKKTSCLELGYVYCEEGGLITDPTGGHPMGVHARSAEACITIDGESF